MLYHNWLEDRDPLEVYTGYGEQRDFKLLKPWQISFNQYLIYVLYLIISLC